ncbi:MAG: LytR C-terminal domain-containing protein [Actinomycetota bacterium]
MSATDVRVFAPERASRTGIKRRRKRWLGLGLLIGLSAALAAVVSLVNVSRPGSGPAGSTESDAGGPASELTMLAVRAEPAFVMVIGSGGGREPMAVVVPPNLATSLPTMGVATSGDASHLPGRYLAASTSNLIGTPLNEYAVLDLQGLAGIVERRGGLEVELARQVQIGERVRGPGAVTLSGSEVRSYVTSGEGRELQLRWEEIAGALLRERVSLARPDLLESSNFVTVRNAIAESRGAPVVELPTVPVDGGIAQPDQAAIRELFSSSFGIDPTPEARISLLSAAGGVATQQRVTALMVGDGFQISAYATAHDPHQLDTKIIATSSGSVDEARRIQKLLGVGKVFLGGGSSGMSDVTILLGVDYLRQ